MSADTIKLRVPVTVDGALIESIPLRSPTTEELRKLRAMNASAVVVGSRAMALLTGLSRAALDEIDDVNTGFKQALYAIAGERIKAVHHGR